MTFCPTDAQIDTGKTRGPSKRKPAISVLRLTLVEVFCGVFFIATVLLNILRTIVRNIATSLQNRSYRKFQKRLDFVWVFLKFPKHKSTLIKPNIIFLYFTLSSYLCVCVFLSYHYLARLMLGISFLFISGFSSAFAFQSIVNHCLCSYSKKSLL